MNAGGARNQDVDRLFQALGDPTRRAILAILSQAPTSASRLAEPLGVSVTAIGQHLQVLEEVGLVRTRKEGRVRVCAIDPAGFDALEGWIRAHRHTWERRMDVLGDLLADEED